MVNVSDRPPPPFNSDQWAAVLARHVSTLLEIAGYTGDDDPWPELGRAHDDLWAYRSALEANHRAVATWRLQRVIS